MKFNKHIACKCGFEYTHIESVTVFARNNDEGPTGLVITAHVGCEFGRKPKADIETASMDANPAPRRDAVKIELICEECEETSVFIIAQHKGITYVDSDVSIEEYR